ncbi:MAG: hypothetical protein JWN61_1924 [Pseudonocardiales bacterium]|nr:hypothetical protein [Pseudonocardiales bacterium]
MLMTFATTHSLLSGGASAEAPPGCEVCEQGFIYGTTGFAGSYAVATPDGLAPNTYCITQGLNYPNSAHSGPVGTDYADQAVWAAFLDRAGATDTDRAAVSMRVHRDLEGNSTEWGAFADLREHSDALWAQAAALAGPYTAAIEWLQRPDAGTGGAGVLVISVRSSSGTPLPYAQMTLSGGNMALPGSADTGPTGIIELAVAVLLPGPWTIGAAAANLPPTTVLRYDALANEQTVVGPGPRTSAAPVGATGSWDVPTTVTALKIDATTRLPVAGAVIEIRSAGGPVVTAFTTTAEPLPVALPPGEYSAREIREPDGYLIDDAAAHPFAVTLLGGRVDLVWADTPAVPTIATRASAPRVSPGDAVHDRITVAGLPPSIAPFPVLVRYLGPVPPPADGNCARLPAAAFAAAGVIAQATIAVTGNGEYATPAFTAPPERGCTTFDVSSRRPLWPGGPVLSAAPNAVDESVEVVSVQISTTVSPAVVEPGGSVSDRIVVAGLPAWSGPRQLTVSLIGPVAAPAGGRCADLSAAAFESARLLTSLVLEITADGALDSPALPVDVTDGQCVTIEIVDGHPLWPGGPAPTSPRGQASETALVHKIATPAPGPTTAPPAVPVPLDNVGEPYRPALADTGPAQTRALLASGAALVGGGIGLLLLIPGARTARRDGHRAVI